MGPIFFRFLFRFFFKKLSPWTLEILAPTVTYFKKNTFGAITMQNCFYAKNFQAPFKINLFGGAGLKNCKGQAVAEKLPNNSAL